MIEQVLKAPFPWFGGKSRAADLIWPRMGNPMNYVEPFAGSLAVLLRRPHEAGNEIVNDLDCYVANAWRAIKFAPDEVAAFCDWPVNEADLHAKHRWLHGRAEFRERMKNDPDFYDARIAGFWVWGLSCWIGDNFCRPKDQQSLPHLTGGQGVARQVPHLTGGKGSDRATCSVNKNVAASPANDWRARRGAERSLRKATIQTENLMEWFGALSERLRFTKVCCGSWERVITKASTFGQGLTGILLDPPYDTDGHDDVYGELSRGVSGAVRDWAIANGENHLMRIALCGYESEHSMPSGWSVLEWKAAGGYGSQSGNENCKRERIWFSPHCLNPQPDLFK